MKYTGYVFLPKFPQTPAPWYDDGYRIHAPTDDNDKRNGRVIVEYKHSPDFVFGDSNVITAAPKLLAALIVMTQHRIQQMSMTNATKVPSDIERAIEAIAEANGWRIQ